MENEMFAIIEVLIFVGGILIGYSFGKGWMKKGFKDVKEIKS